MRNPQVRVGDADREQTVAALQQYVTDGYLSLDEFEQRSSTAYRATTRGELSAVTEDLAPAEQAPVAEPRPTMGCGRPGVPPLGRRNGSALPAAAVVGLVGAALVIGLMVVMMVIMMVTGGMGMMGGMR